jgi:DNA-binding response OmpR family regulator
MPAGLQYEFGPFRLDRAARLLFRDSERVTLTPKAVEVLLALVDASGNLVGSRNYWKKFGPMRLWKRAALPITFHFCAKR